MGETTCDLKTRLNNHRYTIRKKRLDLPVSKHFTEAGHSEWDIKCMSVDHIPPLRWGGDRLTHLKRKELEWIFNVDALKPQGLNVEFKTTSQMQDWQWSYKYEMYMIDNKWIGWLPKWPLDGDIMSLCSMTYLLTLFTFHFSFFSNLVIPSFSRSARERGEDVTQ